jgi:hypothetical protein
VSVSALEDVRAPQQGELFGEPVNAPTDERAARAEKSMDALRRKYGAGVVRPASALVRDPGVRERESEHP